MTLSPAQIQLDGDGPFVLPAAQEFAGWEMHQGRLPAHLRLRVSGNKEVQIPLTGEIMRELHQALGSILSR